MHDAYAVSHWQSLYTTLGGSAAALAGLLFIAVSLQIRRIAVSPIYRARAWGNTYMIVSLVIDAGLVLTPQGVTDLGVELLVTPVVFIVTMSVTMRRVVAAGRRLPWRPFMSIFLNLVCMGAGLSLVTGHGGGMYLVTLYFLATIVWVMWGAWGLLLAIGEDDADTDAAVRS